MMGAAPAYTAVPARHTLQQPPPPPSAAQPPKVTWSPAVRLYVQRAFEQDNAIPGIDQKAMQDKLKVIITEAAESGRLEMIDWRTYPLPQHMIKQEREQAALYGAQNAVMTNMNAALPPTYDGAYSPPPQNQRKRKSPDTQMTLAEELDTTPPWKKNQITHGLEDRITGKSKAQSKKQKKIENMRLNAELSNADALQRRRQRFGHTPEPSPYLSSHEDSPAPTGPVVGTCETLEKNYFRLTAPPAPHTVRPLRILEQALDLVRKKWKNDHNYTYACDQLKSMRQDLTVQRIKTEFTVKVYEAHARIALEMGDLGEYNQCQTQLRALYKSHLGGKPEEFVAYRILYYIYTRNRTDLNDVLADLTPADKQKPGVQHALRVRSALAAGNYHKFFRLYDEAPFMGPYLLDMFINRERLAAMAAICKA